MTLTQFTVIAQSDANAPKKALTAFLLFSNSVRNQCRSENPELKMTQISGVIGKKWKSLSVEDQKKWSELAAKNKAEYQVLNIVLSP